MKREIAILFAIALLLITPSLVKPVFALGPIDITTVDPAATGYGTFQSHNQKVVANQYGIFITHLHTRTEAFINNTWRLSRSTDGGKTFTTVYEAANATHSPVLETDPDGYLYVIYSGESNATLVKFRPNNNFSVPEILTTLPSGSAQKFAMVLDWPRRQMYYIATHSVSDFFFFIIPLDGGAVRRYSVTQPGSSAASHYPHLYLDNQNVLYLAWTTVPNSGVYLYWDIHFMLSKDGGNTWQKPDGTALTIPVVADETGPTDRITLDDEFNVHTWLWTMIVKNNKASFAYEAQSNPARQHYVRYDLSSGKKDKDTYPDWKGETISLLNLDGFCATDFRKAQSSLFCVSKTRDGKLGALVSFDNGDSWHDYALSDYSGENYSSIGGAREVTADGDIIGSYSDARGDYPPVRFFRIKKAVAPTSTPKPVYVQGDLNRDGKVDIFDYNLLVQNFGKTGSAGWIPADINADGKVDIFDYNILVGNFGKTK